MCQGRYILVNRRSLLWSGGILGFGLGGFFDGIVLHQILQWHHFASSLIPTDTVQGLELNTLWDGLFHISAYATVVLGLVLLWRAIQHPQAVHSPRTVISGVLIGFGIFHVFDSIANHWLLNLHHICYGPNTATCDAGYFVIGIMLIAAGMLMRRMSALPTVE